MNKLYFFGLIFFTIACSNNHEDVRRISHKNQYSSEKTASVFFHKFNWDSANFYFRLNFDDKNNWNSSQVSNLQDYAESCIELGLIEIFESLLDPIDSLIHDSLSHEFIRNLNLKARLKYIEGDTAGIKTLTTRALKLNGKRHILDSIQFVRSKYYVLKSNLNKGKNVTEIQFESLIDFFPKKSNHENLILFEILKNLQWLKLRRGDYEGARKIVKAADSVFRNYFPNDLKRQIETLQISGNVDIYLNNPSSAYKSFKKIREIYKTLPDRKEKIAELESYFAVAWWSQKNYTRAKESYLKALRLYEEKSPSLYVVKKITILQNLLALNTENVSLDDVKFLYEKSMILIQDNPNFKNLIPEFDFALGRIFLDLNEIDLAQKYILKAYEVFRDSQNFLNNKSKVALFSQFLGDLYILQGENSKGYEEFKIGHNAAITSPQNPIRLSALECRIADYFRTIKNYDSAFFYIQRSLMRFDKSVEKTDISMNPKILHRKVVNTYLLNALQLKTSILASYFADFPKMEFKNHTFKTSLLSDRLIDSLKNNIDQNYDRLNFLNDRKDIYHTGVIFAHHLYKDIPNPHYIKSAYLLAEKAKSNNLLWNSKEFDRINSIRPNEDQENDLYFFHSKIASFESRIKMLSSQSQEIINVLRDSLFKYRNKYDYLLAQINEENPGYDRSKYNTKVISLDSLQSSLLPSETLIEYFRTDTALYAFGVNQEDATFQKLALPKDFDRELEDFLRSSQIEPLSEQKFREYYAQTAHRFYQTLLQPLLDSLKAVPHEGKSKLIIVPDGKLGYLPFDALLTAMPEDVYDYKSYPFLMKEYSIRSAFSATLMQVLKNKEVQEKELMAAFAPSYMNKESWLSGIKGASGESCEAPDEEKFRELMQAGLELDKILEHINGVRFDSVFASEAQFKAIANQYRVLHLNMHGFTNDCDPMYSGLAFTPRTMLQKNAAFHDPNPTNEGILHAYEIYNMRINAELVVMSACQTGLGKIQAGEGIMSLARAFAHAGSPNTVMSLWQVDEAATRKLMTNFYKYLGEGEGKDEALQLAKLDYLNNNAEAHPFYWAGFVLVGDDKPIVEDSWLQTYWWMILLGVSILIGSFLILRRYSSPARA